MSLKNAFTIIFGKLMVKTLHLLGRDAGNFPGLVLWTINKDCLKAFKVDCPIVAVTGTNGKTSVTNYLSHIFSSGGKKIITNPEGNNLDTGICSLLLNHCDMRGRVHADYLVLETDESHVPVVNSKLNLQTLVLLNFFRDQLDRNGEVETLILKVKKFLETFEGNVVLNADDALRDAGVLQHGLDAADDIIAAVQHLLRIAGQPHFTLGSVDQQGIHLLLGLQLDVGREACAAQTHQAALAHGCEEAGLIGHFRCLDSRVHGLFAIGLDNDRVAHAAIGQTEGLHRGNRAGDAGVDVCRDEAASLADLSANEYLVALFDQSFGGSADMLAHEDAYLRGQRHRDRFACSSCLVMRRMRAKRRTFQLVQHGIKSPILLELPPPRPCRRTGTGTAAA